MDCFAIMFLLMPNMEVSLASQVFCKYAYF